MNNININLLKKFNLKFYLLSYIIFIFLISTLIKQQLTINHTLAFIELIIYYTITMPFIQFNIDIINNPEKTNSIISQQIQNKDFIPYFLMADSFLFNLPTSFLIKYNFIKLIITSIIPIIVFMI